jgi:hypothetical protein
MQHHHCTLHNLQHVQQQVMSRSGYVMCSMTNGMLGFLPLSSYIVDSGVCTFLLLLLIRTAAAAGHLHYLFAAHRSEHTEARQMLA